MADLTDMQEHVLPYLQSFCSLEEKAPEKFEVEAGKTVLTGNKEKFKSMEPRKKSIHERLTINKEIIAKQLGKDRKEKGGEIIVD